jgi:hypothetical protein
VSSVLTDGTALQVLQGEQSYPALIALDANSVYWTTELSIRHASLDGGLPVELVTSPDPFAFRPRDIVVNATHLFWTDDGDPESVSRVPLDGGPATLLASGEDSGYPSAIAIDDTHVYWVASDTGTSIRKVPLDGGTVTVLASDLSRVVDIAVYAGQVYFVLNDADVQSLARVPTSTGPRRWTASARPQSCPDAERGPGRHPSGAARAQAAARTRLSLPRAVRARASRLPVGGSRRRTLAG